MKKYAAPKIRSERLELGVFGCYSGGFDRIVPTGLKGRGRIQIRRRGRR